jgi:DNA-binding CsgD family transcriptional regulator
MNARSAVVQMLRCVDSFLYPEWAVRDSLSSENAALHDRHVNNDQNPRLNLNIARGLSGASAILRDEERFRPGCPHLARLRERLALIGMGRSISVALRIPKDRQLTLLLHRAYGDGREFGTRDEEFLRELAPHLKRSVELFERIGTLQGNIDLLKEFADRMNIGIVVVDGRGTVRWQNRWAELIVGRSRHVKVTGGILRCANAEDQRVILRFLDQVDSSRPPHRQRVATIGAPHCNPIQVLAMPVRVNPTAFETARPGGAPVALLLSERDRKMELSPSDIRELFGLTPAEAALAAALGDGLTLQDYAVRHGITVGTARIQLKSIFSKTGTGRQPDLVRLLCGSIPARTLRDQR